jgi:hypothetical protein
MNLELGLLDSRIPIGSSQRPFEVLKSFALLDFFIVQREISQVGKNLFRFT